MNIETVRVRSEARGENVTVNGWQEGSQNVPGFVTVTDKTTRTTFAVKHHQPLADALGKAQARMVAGQRKVARHVTKNDSEGILGRSGTTNAA
jgi:hypothetical protein